jgi:hypothetical protein
MQMLLRIGLEVNVPEGRMNANELFDAMNEALLSVFEEGTARLIEGYQDYVIAQVCSRGHGPQKVAWCEHKDKQHPGSCCTSRSFVRAGSWAEERRLRGERGEVSFRPRMVKCARCGRHLTPVLAALELRPYQTRTEQLLCKVVEAVAETSYRRSMNQLSVLAEVPVAKSTAHRWAASVELPVRPSGEEDVLAADGTGFKNQQKDKGQVRLVLKIGPEGKVAPVGVWAGSTWEQIAREVQEVQMGQARLFVSDGERGLEDWLGRLAQESQRCQWHASREVGYALWEDNVPGAERTVLRRQVSRLVALEIPEEDLEFVSEAEKRDLRDRLRVAEQQVEALEAQFDQKGYKKAATYLRRARDQLFSHLKLWIETGIIAPRTSSIVENLVRELVRRLKKIGWNWSDAGAERLGRIVMIRRYDAEAWHHFWQERMNLRGRCQITLSLCQVEVRA